jgi:hypothetical protein
LSIQVTGLLAEEHGLHELNDRLISSFIVLQALSKSAEEQPVQQMGCDNNNRQQAKEDRFYFVVSILGELDNVRSCLSDGFKRNCDLATYPFEARPA